MHETTLFTVEELELLGSTQAIEDKNGLIILFKEGVFLALLSKEEALIHLKQALLEKEEGSLLEAAKSSLEEEYEKASSEYVSIQEKLISAREALAKTLHEHELLKEVIETVQKIYKPLKLQVKDNHESLSFEAFVKEANPHVLKEFETWLLCKYPEGLKNKYCHPLVEGFGKETVLSVKRIIFHDPEDEEFLGESFTLCLKGAKKGLQYLLRGSEVPSKIYFI